MNNKEINGFKYEFSGSKEMYYLDEYDFNIFLPSRTLYLNFESEREGESTRISFLLTEEQFNNLDVNLILETFERILFTHNIRIAYNIHTIREELECEKVRVNKFLNLHNSEVKLDTLDYKLLRFTLELEGESDDSFVLIEYQDKDAAKVRVKYFPYVDKFTYDDHLLKDSPCDFEDKSLHIEKIKSTLKLYFNYI